MNGTQLEIAWAEWKAEALNRLFQKQGVTKRRGRITAETVRHGENRLPTQVYVNANDDASINRTARTARSPKS